MGTITINGKTYSGNNVAVIGGNVIIGGKIQEKDMNGIVEINIKGNPVSVESDSSVKVYGNVEGNVTAGGSVKCNDVNGSINSGGSVKCDNVSGSVNSGGSLSCKNSKVGAIGNGIHIKNGIHMS